MRMIDDALRLSASDLMRFKGCRHATTLDLRLIEAGEVKDTNLDSYTPMRMADVPDVDVEFIASTEVPVGLGEPATTVVGPAIGNAIFNASGARVRHLPIRSEDVLNALKTKS